MRVHEAAHVFTPRALIGWGSVFVLKMARGDPSSAEPGPIPGDTLTVTPTRSAFATTVKRAPDTHSSWTVQVKRQPVTISSPISGQYTRDPALGSSSCWNTPSLLLPQGLCFRFPLSSGHSHLPDSPLASRQWTGSVSHVSRCSLVPTWSAFSPCLPPGLSV